MLFKMIQVGQMGVNCYVVASETTRKGIVIDPGDEADTILGVVRELNLEIDLIVNTHAHFDHTMALAKVQAATKAKFAIHRLEAPSLNAKPRAFSAWLGPMDPLPNPDLLLEDGDSVAVDGVELEVIHTPGHTPGGICLLGEGFVITGDTLFALGVGRTDFPGGDWDELVKSIRKRLFVLPDDTLVFPGHGPRSKIGIEKVRNPFVGAEADAE